MAKDSDVRTCESLQGSGFVCQYEELSQHKYELWDVQTRYNDALRSLIYTHHQLSQGIALLKMDDKSSPESLEMVEGIKALVEAKLASNHVFRIGDYDEVIEADDVRLCMFERETDGAIRVWQPAWVYHRQISHRLDDDLKPILNIDYANATPHQRGIGFMVREESTK